MNRKEIVQPSPDAGHEPACEQESMRGSAARAARTLTIIPPVPRTPAKLKVASYCRVSTADAGQRTSIEAQKRHFEEYISSNSEWEFAGNYWDIESGTRADNRPELQRLIAACRAGRVNLILTKSISRFARNTTDALEMVRSLTALGVEIRFEKERIDTGTMESELLLTLFASFAAEESRSISANVTWTKQMQFREGTFRFSNAPYGFDLADGKLVVNEEEAVIVREIYDAVLCGMGMPAIAKELNRRGVPTSTKKLDGSPGVWTAGMLNALVRNVIYIGDCLHQKTYRDSQFKVHRNRGEVTRYYAEGQHEAIVDKDTFALAQRATVQRGLEKRASLKKTEDRDPHANRYAFSAKLVCARCGSSLRRTQQHTVGGSRYHWRCVRHCAGGCDMKQEYEGNLKNAFSTMMNKLVYARGVLLDAWMEEALEAEKRKKKEDFRRIKQRLIRIMDERNRISCLIGKGYGEPVPFHRQLLALEAEENGIRAELAQMTAESGQLKAVKALRGALDGWNGDVEAVFQNVVSRAVVETGKYVTFRLHCGLALTENLAAESASGSAADKSA